MAQVTAGSTQIVVAVGQNFTASTFNLDSNGDPPDSNGAAGPNHFVELINGRFSVFDKATGARIKTSTDLVFWQQAGLSIPSGWDVTDPRLIYDSSSQRWFASQIDFDPTGTINTNRFLLAVSASSDPTGPWHAIAIPTDPGGSDFADFPTLGLDSQGVYLSGDMFDPASAPLGPTLLSIPKAGLLQNPPVSSGRTWFGIMNYNNRGTILEPIVCFDASGAGNILASATVGLDLSGNPVTNTSLVSFQVQNPAGPGQATLTASSFISVPPYTISPFPTQPDGSMNLDNGDARFSAKVYEVGGVQYAVHNTELNNLAALHWYRIDAVNHRALETGTLSDPLKDLYYPSIAANAAGTVVIGYNASSISTFVSSFAVVGSTVNGVTTFGKPILLKAGTASYQNTDATGNSRWGDYSATCVDPVDPNRFWTIQEIASGRSSWSTQVTELLTGFPTLSASVLGNNLLLSWSGTLFSLQMTPSLESPNWSTVSQSFSTNNGVVTAQIPMGSAPSGFFRLQAP